MTNRKLVIAIHELTAEDRTKWKEFEQWAHRNIMRVTDVFAAVDRETARDHKTSFQRVCEHVRWTTHTGFSNSIVAGLARLYPLQRPQTVGQITHVYIAESEGAHE